METIYEWLLQNTGNAGNYYTVLNAQHQVVSGEPDYIDVMVRDKDYEVITLIISSLPSDGLQSPDSNHLQGRSQKATYFFQNEQYVIDYLSEGKPPEPGSEKDICQLQVTVLEAADKHKATSFPPVDQVDPSV